jgi:hypothetical protein
MAIQRDRVNDGELVRQRVASACATSSARAIAMDAALCMGSEYMAWKRPFS